MIAAIKNLGNIVLVDIAKGVAITPHDNCVAFAQNILSYFGNPINQPLVIRHRLTQDGTYIIRARGTAGKASVWDGRIEGGNTGTYRLSLSQGDIAPQDDPDYGKIFHTPNENIDLWKQLKVLAKPDQIEWNWVKGHSKDPMNDLADKLAKEATPI